MQFLPLIVQLSDSTLLTFQVVFLLATCPKCQVHALATAQTLQNASGTYLSHVLLGGEHKLMVDHPVWLLLEHGRAGVNVHWLLLHHSLVALRQARTIKSQISIPASRWRIMLRERSPPQAGSLLPSARHLVKVRPEAS